MRQIYFDNSSTAFPKAPGVSTAVSHMISDSGYNINRGGYDTSYQLSDSILYIRERLCALFGYDKPRNVVFTVNVTMSINMLLYGFLKPGDHIVVSSMEHNAVMRPLSQLARRGITYSMAQADETGAVTPQAVEKCITENTKAVCMLHASNVCGTINDIEAIGRVCKEKDVFFIVDAAQSAGLIPIDMKKMNISALCFTGHKGLLGPQGVGGFIITPQLERLTQPVFCGGTGSLSDSFDMPASMPDKFEPGTMGLPAIIGLGAGLSYLENRTVEAIHNYEMELTNYFLSRIKEVKCAKVIGKQGIKDRTAVVSIDFLGQDNAEIAFRLDDEYGVMTRCGMHCAPSAHKSLGTFPQGTVRFSFGYANTAKEIDVCIDGLKRILEI